MVSDLCPQIVGKVRRKIAHRQRIFEQALSRIMSRDLATTVLTGTNVRQWRDFLDVLQFARQNRAQLVVPDRFPGLDALLELKANAEEQVKKINRAYAKGYSDLRVYRGDFDSLSSLMVLKNLRVSSGRNFQKELGKKLVCFSSHNARNSQLEAESDFLAIALMGDGNYLGTKIFMRADMIELVSL